MHLNFEVHCDKEVRANESLGASVCATLKNFRKCSLETFRASLVADANGHNVAPENVILLNY